MVRVNQATQRRGKKIPDLNEFHSECANPRCEAQAATLFHTSTPLCGNHIAKLYGETQRGLELLTAEAQASKLFPMAADNYEGRCPSCDKFDVLWRLNDGTVRCTNAADGCSFSVDERIYWRLDQANMADRAGEDNVVYYMQFRDMVKIGTSGCLHRRLREIQHDRLLAFEFGDSKVEKRRHEKFMEYRGPGEWFRMESPLMEHISTVRKKC